MTLPGDILKKIKSAADRCSELEITMSDHAVASDPEQMKIAGKEFSEVEYPARLYRNYTSEVSKLEKARADMAADSDPEMKALYEEEILNLESGLETLEEQIEDFMTQEEVEENRPVIMEIRSGTGGEEASLFAGDLYRMYTRYAENLGWKVEPMNFSEANLGGLKEVIFGIKGPNAFNHFKFESGVHRVQRVPVTEGSGRIHTSAATVAVLIEPDAVDVVIDPSEIKVDTFRASGAGGQHVNKTDSAIRITHLPTGLTVECQDERSQHQNREKAMRLLRTRLLDALQIEQQAQISEDRRNQVGSGDRSQRIRTYNFPQNRISDHRVGLTLYKLDLVIQGDFALLIDPLTIAMKELDADNEGDN